MCRCHRTITVLDGTTAELFCTIHGTETIYRNDAGMWETGQQRMERMRRVRKCAKCGAEVIDYYGDWVKGQTVNCDRCNVKQDIEYKQGYVKKHNPASPWRLGQRNDQNAPRMPLGCSPKVVLSQK